MKISDLKRAMFFLSPDLEVTRVTTAYFAIKHSHGERFYRIDFLIENYYSILETNQPIHYLELYPYIKSEGEV